MVESVVTETFLDEVEQWSVRRLPHEEYVRVISLIREIRRLRKLIHPTPAAMPSRRAAAAGSQDRPQCQFIREVGGRRFRCTAEAKYEGFCGYHRVRPLKRQSKGCHAIARTGAPCMAVVMRDGLCPKHWEKTFGHEYIRDGRGFRCALCSATFNYRDVEGWGRGRNGSIKRVAKCPSKEQTKIADQA